MAYNVMCASVSCDVPRAAAHSGYDVIADEYYELRHSTSRNFDAATTAYLRDQPFTFPNDGMALDLGAGRGRLVEYCGIAPSRIVQVDVALRMLTLPKRESALGRVLADALALPFRTGVFTLVAAFLFDPFNERRLFAEVARVMRSGGVFIGTLPHYQWGRALRSWADKPIGETTFALESGQFISRPSVLSRYDQLADVLSRSRTADIEE